MSKQASYHTWVQAYEPPNDDRFVLIKRKSGYTTIEHEVMTARYDVEYRPNQPWIDITGDSLMDRGSLPICWRELMEEER